MDVFLANPATSRTFLEKVSEQLPEGIAIIEVTPVSVQAPSLQSQVRFAEYVVEVSTTEDLSLLEARMAELLAKRQLPWHHVRDTGERHYDLRALIDHLWLAERTASGCRIGMRLRCDTSGSGRPEQVALALGFEETPLAIERVRLLFA